VRTGSSSATARSSASRPFAVAVTGVYCFLGALILLKVVDVVLWLRVPDEDEFAGLDLSQHGEKAYTP
jgi:Amt family ammonium transporter